MSRIISKQLRLFSTKVSKNVLTSADLLKSYNYENKALYGAVNKTKKKTKNVIVPPDTTNRNETEISSEMYWLLARHNSNSSMQEPIKKETKKRAKKRIKQETTPVASIDENIGEMRSKTSEQPVASDSSAERSRIGGVKIPFSDRGIQSITRFPLTETDIQEIPETTIDTYESRYPSVGKILQATMSESARNALINWKLTKIQELGEDGFLQLQQSQLNAGKMFHKSLEDYFSTGIVPTPDSDTYPVWQSVEPALKNLSPQIQFTERMIEHPFLKYRGIVDCVCTVNSETTVIEWKKSDKVKTTINATYDAPLQLCAYLGALAVDPQYKLYAQKGFVIVANTDGLPAQVHALDEMILRRYWQLWLQRLQEFWIRTRDGTLPEPI